MRPARGRPLSGILLALCLMFCLAAPARAAEPFDAGAFATAQAAGRVILVDVYAPWCPVCRRQQPTIAKLAAERPKLVVFRVDFDTQKEAVRRFKAQRQSTLILFKGKREVARLAYESDPERIAALVAKGF